TIGGDGGWDFMTIDAERRHLFIAHSTQVEVYDLEKDSVIHHILNTEGVHGIAVASAEGHGFISCGKSNTVLMFDLNTFDTLRRIPVGTKPDAIIYDPYSKHIFVMNADSHDISVLDATNGSVESTIKLSGAPEFAVSDEQGKVFVNLEDKSAIVRIDSKKNTVTATWPVAPGKAPTGIAMHIYSHTLFIACANEKVVLMDSRTGKVMTSVEIGKGVDAIVYDTAAGHGQQFPGFAISSNGDGTATVIGAPSDDWYQAEEFETITTARGARTLALDPKTENLYFVTAELAQAPIATTQDPHPRPPIMPGTFMVLKYGRVRK
ncbi:MAG: YncE family protein, partial [Bacteroidota bacterium]|nr:YncE family protein [Bacteroidota bacterium]